METMLHCLFGFWLHLGVVTLTTKNCGQTIFYTVIGGEELVDQLGSMPLYIRLRRRK